MNVFKTSILLLLICFLIFEIRSQEKPGTPWVSYPTANVTSYGVYHFRKTFDLDAIPAQLKVHVSADNRYIFYVNGEMVSYGPAKGDLKTYKYDILEVPDRGQCSPLKFVDETEVVMNF